MKFRNCLLEAQNILCRFVDDNVACVLCCPCERALHSTRETLAANIASHSHLQTMRHIRMADAATLPLLLGLNMDLRSRFGVPLRRRLWPLPLSLGEQPVR